MDTQQQRITEDLAGMLDGELRCDPVNCALYASDASLYQIVPVGVAFPKSREDVETLARYSAETDLPLVARGAGTGLAGSALGKGLVIDFSRFMNQVESIDETTVRVQPGIVCAHLNALLKEQGRYFPPDPSNIAMTTIGGMLGVDAAGSRSISIGSTRDHVKQLEVVVSGGNVFNVEQELLSVLQSPHQQQEDHQQQSNWRRTIISRVAKLLTDYQPEIELRQPAGIRNCSGYFFRGVLGEESIDFPRMLVGSEGTLGLFTAATLQTLPIPRHRGVVVLLFAQIEGAIASVNRIAELQPTACDLLGRRLLSLAREADLRFEKMISPAAEAALIIEQTGDNERDVKTSLQSIIQSVKDTNYRFAVAAEGYSQEEVDFLWSLPGRVVSRLSQLKGRTRPVPFVEDIAVPPAALQEFLLQVQRIFQKHEVTATLYAHAAAGQLHLRPFLPTPAPEEGSRLEAIARDLYQLVFSMGGSMSGEHGDGLSRTAFIRSQYGPLYRAFQELKDIFDPHNLLNPGKIVNDDPHITRKHLRTEPGIHTKKTDHQLNWELPQLLDEATLCIGCGECRTVSSNYRMCPFFHVDHTEQATPRSKANLMRGILQGHLDFQEMESAEMTQLMKSCFNCKQCELECPSNVNIPQLMIEARADYVTANGQDWNNWLMARMHIFSAVGCSIPLAANWMIGHASIRWVLEKVLGIARQRKLPRFARRSFLRLVHSRSENRLSSQQPQQTVVYFVDQYANYHDSELAEAFLAVLRHHDINVIVPQEQTVSGMSMISAGELDEARRLAEQNVNTLAELAREGHTIVCTEPSAALALKQEYPMLLKHPDVNLVAGQVMEAGEYLLNLLENKILNTDFQPLDLQVGYHMPCHLKPFSKESAFLRLLDLIPDLILHKIEKGCSGMAGAYGITRENFPTSIQIGRDLITEMRSGKFAVGTTECSSCKMQMEQGVSIPTLHPIKLLALAYGIMPELENKLLHSNNKLIIT